MEKIVETDVLVVGGGISGCMAAIRATEHGVKVVLAEKSNVRRSGNNASGVDHIWHWNPLIHGPKGFSLEDAIRSYTEKTCWGWCDQDLVEVVHKEAYDRILDLERFGLKVRCGEMAKLRGKMYDEYNKEHYEGKYPAAAEAGNFDMVEQFHHIPTSVSVEGRDIKVILDKECKRRGVNILNRTMITNLLTYQGSCVGAMGVNTRTGEFITIKSKSTVLATGRIQRLYGLDFTTYICPVSTGDGHAMAFRVGIELAQMEFPEPTRLHCKGLDMGPGMGTWGWADRFVNAKGEEIPPDKLREAMKVGPVYKDFTRLTKDQIKYAEWHDQHEALWGMTEYMLRDMGLNLGEVMIEMDYHWPPSLGRGKGCIIDTNCRTNLKGLFACGDVTTGMMVGASPQAFVQGWRAGDQAAKDALKAPEPVIDEKQIEIERQRVLAPLKSEEGITWQELNIELGDIMTKYAYDVRSEMGLKAGLERVEELKKLAAEKLFARNPHELMRCLEVMNLLDVAKIIMSSALERKETREVWPGHKHYRVDYPNKDDKNWKKWLIIRLENEEVKFRTKPVKLKYKSYCKEPR